MTTTTHCLSTKARSASARASYVTAATKPASWLAIDIDSMFVRHNGQPGGSGDSS